MIKPIMEKILVRQLITNKTDSGLIIPDNVKQEKRGVIVAVGDGDVVNGELVPIVVKVGDTVIWMPYAGQEILVDGEELIVLRQSDIIGVVIEEKKMVLS